MRVGVGVSPDEHLCLAAIRSDFFRVHRREPTDEELTRRILLRVQANIAEVLAIIRRTGENGTGTSAKQPAAAAAEGSSRRDRKHRRRPVPPILSGGADLNG
jgi:hypothetical protein